MSILETIFIGLGLAMDAFAVSVCKGLAIKKMSCKKSIAISAYFGFFQMFMPMVGYVLGITLSELFQKIDHWIAFTLLVFIGCKMIKDALKKEENVDDKTDFNTMLILALATSIDALAVGITYAFLDVSNVIISFILIGVITFIISAIGVKIGSRVGSHYGNKAEFIGGIILLFIAFKILIEHIVLI